jgi:hypothetical protein
MARYRGSLLLLVFAVFLSTFVLESGEARKADRRGNASATKAMPSGASAKVQGKGELDLTRIEALRSLYEQMKNGAPVSDLEAALLQRFGDGDEITFVEADLIISRALFDLQVRGIGFSKLTTDQQSLLTQYELERATQSRRIDSRSDLIANRNFSKGLKSSGTALHSEASTNDSCADAITLTLNIPVAGDTSDPTANDYQLAAASVCFPAGHTATTASGRDVVYSFTAPAAGQYSFRAWQYVAAALPTQSCI